MFCFGSKSTCANFAQVANNGKTYHYKFYSLNYLSRDELEDLNEIVEMYLDYAHRQAKRHIPMTMADWASKLDIFLQQNDAKILQDKGNVTVAMAKAFAESEFEKYRIIQDKLYQSDFDNFMKVQEEAIEYNAKHQNGEIN